jgi:hypothetical protein
MNKKEDYKYVPQYLHKYGLKMVKAIRDNIRTIDLIDTGRLLDSIDYDVTFNRNTWVLFVRINDKASTTFEKNTAASATPPSEYGAILETSRRYKTRSKRISTHKWFSNARLKVPGLTAADFNRGLKEAYVKDTEAYVRKLIKGTK